MKYPHVESGERYVKDVLAGKILACKWIRLACERHASDKSRDWEFKFDRDRAEKACLFMELFPHTKGKWAATSDPFRLEPWQCFMVMSIFGWMDKVNLKRRFRRAMLMVPRKNGKSDLSARIGLYMLGPDNEFGAEIYSGATSEKQAWEVFRPARLMADRTPAFQEHYGVQVMKTNLHIPANGSRFEPIIGKPGDGSSPSCAIIDEYHEHQDDTLFDTMETGMGAREHPLTLIISTSGDNLSGPCFALQKDLEKVLEGTITNERFFGLIYTIDVDDDWASDHALKKANPNYGISVSQEVLKSKQLEAIRNSRKQGVFQTKHLNVWVGARQAFFNLKSWSSCAKPRITPQDFKGRPLHIGLDLASTRDIAALIMEFKTPAGFAVFGKFYLPETIIEGGANQHYAGWAADGRLILTPGNMIDYDTIEHDIIDIHREFGISEVAFDPAYAQMLVQHLMAGGIPCVEMRPTVMNFSEPMKLIDGLIMSGKIQHDGCPVMQWMMSNVVAKTDNKDNVYPNKEKPESKIDGAVALIMAHGRAMVEIPVMEPMAVWA